MHPHARSKPTKLTGSSRHGEAGATRIGNDFHISNTLTVRSSLIFLYMYDFYYRIQYCLNQESDVIKNKNTEKADNLNKECSVIQKTHLAYDFKMHILACPLENIIITYAKTECSDWARLAWTSAKS